MAAKAPGLVPPPFLLGYRQRCLVRAPPAQGLGYGPPAAAAHPRHVRPVHPHSATPMQLSGLLIQFPRRQNHLSSPQTMPHAGAAALRFIHRRGAAHGRMLLLLPLSLTLAGLLLHHSIQLVHLPLSHQKPTFGSSFPSYLTLTLAPASSCVCAFSPQKRRSTRTNWRCSSHSWCCSRPMVMGVSGVTSCLLNHGSSGEQSSSRCRFS